MVGKWLAKTWSFNFALSVFSSIFASCFSGALVSSFQHFASCFPRLWACQRSREASCALSNRHLGPLLHPWVLEVSRWAPFCAPLVPCGARSPEILERLRMCDLVGSKISFSIYSYMISVAAKIDNILSVAICTRCNEYHV